MRQKSARVMLIRIIMNSSTSCPVPPNAADRIGLTLKPETIRNAIRSDAIDHRIACGQNVASFSARSTLLTPHRHTRSIALSLLHSAYCTLPTTLSFLHFAYYMVRTQPHSAGFNLQPAGCSTIARLLHRPRPAKIKAHRNTFREKWFLRN